MGVNLHHVVRGAIQQINPDTPGEVYVSTGAQTVRGVRRPTFALLPTERLQVQAMTHRELYHLDGLNRAGGMIKVYAYGRFDTVSRPDGQGGDLIRLGSEWWAIQHVLEWWPGWCCFSAVRQLNAGTLDALLAQLATADNPEPAP